MADLPEHLIQLQRAAHQAWAALEAYRKAVDADRRATATPPADSWGSPVLRPWTDEENARYAELHTAAVQAQEAVRAGITEAGLNGGYDVVQGLHQAAREASGS